MGNSALHDPTRSRRHGELPPGQPRQVGDGGAAVEDLEDEQVDGGDRVEDSLPPRVTDLVAQRAKGVRRQDGGDVVSDLS